MPKFPTMVEHAHGLSDQVFSRLSAKARQKKEKVYSLHVGDTWLDPWPLAMAEALDSSATERLHNYAQVQGEPVLLEAVHQRLWEQAGREVPMSCIQIVSGATAGLSQIAQCLFGEGDEVLLPAPFWPLIRGIIRKRGAKAIEVPVMDRLHDSELDLEALFESYITKRTVAIYLNSPHNPTGSRFTESQVNSMMAMAKRHQLWVLCDEVYEEVYYGEQASRPMWAHPDIQEQYLAVHSFSKGYAMAGARVGYVHGCEKAMEVVRGMQVFSTYCAARSMQRAAAKVLRDGGDWMRQTRRRYQEAAYMAAERLQVAQPQGGTFLFLPVQAAFRSEENILGFLERCLDEGVLVTPGQACGDAYRDWIRLCYTCVPPDELEKALERLNNILVG
jgi:N-succinyldiaminopimelate aminotransferase